PKYVVATVIFTLIMFCTQVLSYGPNTWLPSMTKEMGFGGMQGMLALMMLQIGAAVGTIIGAILIDRGGATQTIVPYFLLGAVALGALAYGTELGVVGIFIAAFFAGVGTIGTSTLMYGVIAAHYPASSRSSAIGFTLGIGRLGAILGPQLGAIFATPRSGLIAFMVPSIAGAALVGVLALVQRGRTIDSLPTEAMDTSPRTSASA
ncbi:MFS transporter, partial [Rhodococcus oxybenzonivorans]